MSTRSEGPGAIRLGEGRLVLNADRGEDERRRLVVVVVWSSQAWIRRWAGGA